MQETNMKNPEYYSPLQNKGSKSKNDMKNAGMSAKSDSYANEDFDVIDDDFEDVSEFQTKSKSQKQ